MALVGMSAAGKSMSDDERARVVSAISADSQAVLPRYADGSESRSRSYERRHGKGLTVTFHFAFIFSFHLPGQVRFLQLGAGPPCEWDRAGRARLDERP